MADQEARKLVGPLPVMPLAPTPWSFSDVTTTVQDANGQDLFVVDMSDAFTVDNSRLAKLIVETMNAAHGG